MGNRGRTGAVPPPERQCHLPLGTLEGSPGAVGSAQTPLNRKMLGGVRSPLLRGALGPNIPGLWGGGGGWGAEGGRARPQPWESGFCALGVLPTSLTCKYAARESEPNCVFCPIGTDHLRRADTACSWVFQEGTSADLQTVGRGITAGSGQPSRRGRGSGPCTPVSVLLQMSSPRAKITASNSDAESYFQMSHCRSGGICTT